MSRRDTFTHIEEDAGRFERMNAHPVDERERDEPGTATELTHQHGEGLVCLFCAWLRARREHLGLVPDAEHAWCERCANEFPVTSGCLHGRLLCGRCKDFCQDCTADIADAADDSLRERLRDGWGDGA